MVPQVSPWVPHSPSWRTATCAQAAAQITPPAVWQGAYDPTTRTRFIPLELILGAYWNGSREPALPAGRFVESLWRGSATWTGPKGWRHRDTGESLMVYDRIRPGVSQKMAVRREGDAIGRVEDMLRDKAEQERIRAEVLFKPGDVKVLADPGKTEPVHFFLFERKRGHCEYFAAATTLVLQLNTDYSVDGVDAIAARYWEQGIRQIVALRDAHRGAVAANAKALALLDHLLLPPTVSIKRVAQRLGCTQPTAAKLVAARDNALSASFTVQMSQVSSVLASSRPVAS